VLNYIKVSNNFTKLQTEMNTKFEGMNERINAIAYTTPPPPLLSLSTMQFEPLLGSCGRKNGSREFITAWDTGSFS
jgi:hypothetical protein